MRERRVREEINGRERLRSAADLLFRREGYAQTSIAMILAGSGVKAPSLYHHFGDKEGLYLDWVLPALAEFGATIRAHAETKDRTIDALCTLFSGPKGLDVLQIAREVELMQRLESRTIIHQALHQEVVRAWADSRGSQAAAEQLALACSLSRPAYLRLFVRPELCSELGRLEA
ncbi:MAG: TetR/AcrR family transcriptional regulator [Fimbriimonadaceae bacterium]|nr:TetR/AcrR family transcriptional regulator [Fimbriimonadaceae bacterium]